MKLILIGYRGTGKTTISDMLSERLRMPVVHMDEVLEDRFAERIASFVEKHGWEEFRNEESLLIDELAVADNIIIDTGGGVVVRKRNIDLLKPDSFMVWLKAAPESIAFYIGRDVNRPSLTGTKSNVEEIIEVLTERTPLYESAADFQIRTDLAPLEECVEQIIKEWKKYNETMETI
ncbi:MAG: shikimate kinase [bacterium]|jgi:shikimate kinase